jgi:hypothetical protein
MKPQIINDKMGNATGVFIPLEDWNTLKSNYPDLESSDQEIPEWQKKLLDSRLEAIAKDPSRVRPIEELFAEFR